MKIKNPITFISNAVISFVLIAVSAVCLAPASGSVFGSSAFSPVYRGNTSGNRVALMFNVYKNTANVNNIMDIAKQYNVKFTFFVGGCWADDNETALKRMVEEGHQIGNHGYFHRDHKKLSFEDNKKEIVNTNNVVKALCGYDITLFAPPSGSFGDNTLKVCEELQLNVIMWSKDTIDWRDHDSNIILSRATANLKGGDLVLMHPTDKTVDALSQILKAVSAAGLNADTVGNTIG